MPRTSFWATERGLNRYRHSSCVKPVATPNPVTNLTPPPPLSMRGALRKASRVLGQENEAQSHTHKPHCLGGLMVSVRWGVPHGGSSCQEQGRPRPGPLRASRVSTTAWCGPASSNRSSQLCGRLSTSLTHLRGATGGGAWVTGDTPHSVVQVRCAHAVWKQKVHN